MRTTNTLFLLLMLWGVSACTTSPAELDLHFDYPVKSWEEIDASDRSRILQEAFESSESWASSPSLFAYHLFNFSELKDYSIHYSAGDIESATTARLTVVRDGFLDDSIRGDIHLVTVEKRGDEWKIVQIRRALRCWRDNQASFSKLPCP